MYFNVFYIKLYILLKTRGLCMGTKVNQSFQIDTELKKKLDSRAKKEDRSQRAIIERALRLYLEKKTVE